MKTGIFYEEIATGIPRRQAEKEAVARILAREYPGIPYGRHESGLPWLQGAYISITHSRKTAVVAVSDAPIGIDLEYPRPRLSQIVPRILTPAELTHFHTPEQLLATWTSKEAAYKAIHSLQGPSCPVTVITAVTLTPGPDNLPLHATVADTSFTLAHTILPDTSLLTTAQPL